MLRVKVAMMLLQKFQYKTQLTCFDFLAVTVAII